MTIDMLHDDVFLEIFDFYMHQARRYPFEGIDTRTRASTLAKRRFWITTPPQFATSLHGQNTREGGTGCLAGLTNPHTGRRLNIRLG
jgi:hypothetical protein